MTPPAILLVDDDPRFLEGLAKLLQSEGYTVHLAGDGETGLRLLREEPAQVVLTDLKMPGLDGIQVLREVKRLGLDIEVVLLTGHGSIDTAVQAMKDGAYDYLTKPLDPERLLQVLRRALERQAMLRHTRAIETELADRVAPGAFIAESPAMRELLTLVDQVAASDATVLIQGESGTGKELIARRIHAGSRRAAAPLVTVNCAAIPEGLLESELFGHEKGAFTGASARKPGRFELADGGTLFLDEVGDLAPAIQAKLLRALQEGEVQRLGATRAVHVDVRIVAATNQDLPRLAQERRFREDLYYRLNVIALQVPPLRSRPEDTQPLAEHFLRAAARRARKEVQGFSAEALALLRHHPWRGNVRELEHAVERAVILARGPLITTADLALSGQAFAGLPQSPTLADFERELILRTLERAGGNQAEAAKALRIARSTLRRKLEEYGLLG